MRPISELYQKLGVQPPKRKFTYTMVNRKQITRLEYLREQAKWKKAMKEFKKSISKYRTGSDNEKEGDGYFKVAVYTYQGIKYS